MDGLNMQSLGKLQLLIPPLAEQEAILKYVAIASQPLISAINRLLGEIELFREYRTRLIAEVVTGKLDVREFAANLSGEDRPETGNDRSDANDDRQLNDEEAEA